MLTKKTRRIAVVALVAGVVVLARAWPDSASRDVAVARISPSGVRHAASADSPRNVGMRKPKAPEANRARILAAAIAEFSSRGYKGASML